MLNCEAVVRHCAQIDFRPCRKVNVCRAYAHGSKNSLKSVPQNSFSYVTSNDNASVKDLCQTITAVCVCVNLYNIC